MSGYSYEVLGGGRYTEYRIRDAQDSRIATCFDETNARTVVDALNRRAPAAEAACETCTGLDKLVPFEVVQRFYDSGTVTVLRRWEGVRHGPRDLGEGPTLAAAVAAARKEPA